MKHNDQMKENKTQVRNCGYDHRRKLGAAFSYIILFWNDRNYRYDGICKRGITYCVRAEDYACAQKQYDEKIYKSYSG